MVSMMGGISERECYHIYNGLVSKRSRFKRTKFRGKKSDNQILDFCKLHGISVERYQDVAHMLEEG